MANLRTAMDAAFWDLNISTPQALDGVSRAVPGDSAPIDGARASRALRIQQLSLLGNGFPLGIIPSLSPSPNHKELGSFALQSLLGKAVFGNWWVGLIGQFRPKKMISSIKAEVSAAEEWDLSLLKDTAKHLVDKSLYAVGLCSQIALTPVTSLLLSTEKHGEKKKRRTKAILFHKLPDHDITLEAAWPELFIDCKGKYWEVPESISLDCSSLVSESGLRYRFGIHKNNGRPLVVGSNDLEVPLALLPGICAKAAFSYEKSKDFWRQIEAEEDVIKRSETDQFWHPSYDIRLKEPHAAISGIIGGTCEAWFGGGKDSPQVDNINSSRAKDRGRLVADLFGSVCYTFQHGKFTNTFGDLTRLDARVDISSASALVNTVSNRYGRTEGNQYPRLSLIFQQQVAGPIVFSSGFKFAFDSSGGSHAPQLEDMIYSLNYSLRILRSGKVVAWYAPKRKEGMIELRLFEF
ncbi:protein TRIGALACTOSYLDIACYLGLYCEROL 4, chloroplastic [Dorcoceras hygrometricum]|uniref:Protein TRIGALACTOSYLDIACYLGLYCEROL 4, chloroplastic n=1 Tax=Dorcoceras hygrometricum TaxID=472368 RepID=A0A2Z7C9C2_9LAMI|nr:protein TRIGALACTOSYLDIACYLGLYCEROL 4, chloroplastic [Dorcoceras hygrometricum]